MNSIFMNILYGLFQLGTSPLHLAAMNNHLDTCEVLLRAGISKDARTKVDRTPLHLAVYEGHDRIVELLLKNKCDVNATDMVRAWSHGMKIAILIVIIRKISVENDPLALGRGETVPEHSDAVAAAWC